MPIMAKPPTFLSKLANRKGFGDVVHNDQLDQDFLLFDLTGNRHGVHHSANILGSDADEWLILGDADDIADMGGGDDLVEGNGGNDTLSGGDGDDVLVGGWGADILDGGADNDHLYGEGGADTFVFKPGMGHDVVYDFVNGIDMIQVVGLVEADITIQAYGTTSTEIVSGDDSMILSGIAPTLISLDDDFVLV
jgi:Ca2+-binding RTX toxin-like protein